eukprot:TRINITY_DN12809_c0_g2_i1.p1 TRINITY_DN12809_c0_g2~~TRINITY_DN12809_c0_g2_i1.p1  ORF type:complete len:526 (-),score=122.18 TRINITY_DN12809_c0_g2_i1:145-1722(-)
MRDNVGGSGNQGSPDQRDPFMMMLNGVKDPKVKERTQLAWINEKDPFTMMLNGLVHPEVNRRVHLEWVSQDTPNPLEDDCGETNKVEQGSDPFVLKEGSDTKAGEKDQKVCRDSCIDPNPDENNINNTISDEDLRDEKDPFLMMLEGLKDPKIIERTQLPWIHNYDNLHPNTGGNSNEKRFNHDTCESSLDPSSTSGRNISSSSTTTKPTKTEEEKLNWCDGNSHDHRYLSTCSSDDDGMAMNDSLLLNVRRPCKTTLTSLTDLRFDLRETMDITPNQTPSSSSPTTPTTPKTSRSRSVGSLLVMPKSRVGFHKQDLLSGDRSFGLVSEELEKKMKNFSLVEANSDGSLNSSSDSNSCDSDTEENTCSTKNKGEGVINQSHQTGTCVDDRDNEGREDEGNTNKRRGSKDESGDKKRDGRKDECADTIKRDGRRDQNRDEKMTEKREGSRDEGREEERNENTDKKREGRGDCKRLVKRILSRDDNRCDDARETDKDDRITLAKTGRRLSKGRILSTRLKLSTGPEK